MSTPRILIVDDEPGLADLYRQFLSGTYDVTTVYDGEQALEVIDDTFDVVLLDRRLPMLTGSEVLAEINNRELGCMVVMTTAVTPESDIIDMGFDAYLTKPITSDELNEVVEQMLTRAIFADRLQEYFALVSKKAALKTNSSTGDDTVYQELDARIEELQNQIDTELAQFSSQDFKAVYGSIETEQELFSF